MTLETCWFGGPKGKDLGNFVSCGHIGQMFFGCTRSLQVGQSRFYLWVTHIFDFALLIAREGQRPRPSSKV